MSYTRRARTALLLAAIVAVLAAPPARAAEPCGPHPWCDTSLTPERRAQLLLSALTLDEKLSLMAGDEPTGVGTGDPANATSRGVPRLDVPTVYFNDGPAGIRKGLATGMPAPISLAATFDPASARRYGAVVGDEARHKGIHVVHAPAVNIVRTPLGGRTFEYYGEDPRLSGRTAVAFTGGLQAQGVVGNVKHYLANNQENNRFTVNAVVGERALREIYLPAFEASVIDGDVGSVMCAYNSVNGEDMCQNDALLDGLLNRELGFRGFVLSDYLGTIADPRVNTAAAANGGLDLELPQASDYSEPALTAALASGQVSRATVDGHVLRILRTMFRFRLFDRRFPDARTPDDRGIDRPAHARVARAVAENGVVLMKNARRLLPLDTRRVDSVAVIGRKADEYQRGGGSSGVRPYYDVTALEGIRRRAKSDVDVRYERGRNPADAAALARRSDVAIVVANDNQTEFVDKPCLTLECGDPLSGNQDGLIDAVAEANPNTIVLLQTGSPVVMPWAGKVRAIVEAWYPGQEGGNAIARVLFGDVDPGGRLPVTFPRRERDTPTAGRPERYPGVAENAQYSEGIFVGYRHYDERRIEPLFPFGHGLSYTSFAYRGLTVRPAKTAAAAASSSKRVATVSVEVRNTGRRRGTEVVQLYVGKPQTKVDQPPLSLAAFRKISLKAGQRRRVRLAVDRRALSYWDVGRDRWTVAAGCYGLLVGRSSRDIRVRGVLARGGARCAGGRTTGRRRARLRLRLSCQGGNLRAGVVGRDRRRLRRVAFYVRGRRVGRATRPPFARVIARRRFRDRRIWRVRARTRARGRAARSLATARRRCPARGARFTG